MTATARRDEWPGSALATDRRTVTMLFINDEGSTGVSGHVNRTTGAAQLR
jgi:hypothetical protein